jgi:hypothetical protein
MHPHGRAFTKSRKSVRKRSWPLFGGKRAELCDAPIRDRRCINAAIDRWQVRAKLLMVDC